MGIEIASRCAQMRAAAYKRSSADSRFGHRWIAGSYSRSTHPIRPPVVTIDGLRSQILFRREMDSRRIFALRRFSFSWGGRRIAICADQREIA
jgi:hypothetical protein